MKLRIGLLLVCLAMSVALGLLLSQRNPSSASASRTGDDEILIGFAMDETRGPRWLKDRAAFTARVEELGGRVSVRVADSNDTQQIKDVEALITEGVDCLVIVPHNGKVMAKGVDMAHAAGIPTIGYDRLISGTPNLSLYASFDNVKVGVLQAQFLVDNLKHVEKPKIVRLFGAKSDHNSFLFKQGQDQVLMPLVESGQIEIIHEDWCDNWEGAVAKRIVNAAITLHGHDIHAVLASADVLSNGAIKALEEEGLLGQVLVTGQDADLVTCQRIVAGTQAQTIYKPIPELAAMIAEMSVKLATGQSLIVRDTIDNGSAQIPMATAEIYNLTKENMMEKVIAEGFHSYDDVYGGIPEDERPPRP